MIAVLAFAALEWSAAALAVASGAHAAVSGSLWATAISGAAAIVAGILRCLAFSRATGRRFDAMMARLPVRVVGECDHRGRS